MTTYFAGERLSVPRLQAHPQPGNAIPWALSRSNRFSHRSLVGQFLGSGP